MYLDSQADPYRRIEARELYRNPWLTVEAHRIVHPSGEPGEHVLVVAPAACGVVVEDGPDLLFARQPRFAARRFVVEIVKGGANAGEAPLAAAQRELREELGIVASEWTPLGRLYEIPSIVDGPVELFLARAVEYVAPEPEAEESIDMVRLEIGAALEAAAGGTFDDAITVAALFRYYWVSRRRSGGGIP
jgi:8-oxo-dGTP pyrophosphatase MutT (NUDIX family)